MTIKEIEALTQKEIEILKIEGKAELLNIKGHDCYLTNLGGAFGYSVLVFKNNHHMHYANDYQLHHSNKTTEELKQWYIKALNNKLYTESELMEDVQTYDEYTAKSYYIRNYWIMQFDYQLQFVICGNNGNPPTKWMEENKKFPYYCPTCFCYVSDKSIIEKANKFINHIEKSFTEAKKNIEVFKKMISYELSNHEACITCDYHDALDSLGLKFEDLTDEQKRVVKKELQKQINNYCC